MTPPPEPPPAAQLVKVMSFKVRFPLLKMRKGRSAPRPSMMMPPFVGPWIVSVEALKKKYGVRPPLEPESDY